MGDASKEHVLSLKVMRLARPKFHEGVAIPLDPADEVSQLIGSAICDLTGQESADMPIGRYLLAPQKFENINLGETFTFYVCVQNVGDKVTSDVCVKIDLQATSQRSILNSHLQDGNVTLEPGERAGAVVNHEIKEIGQHILVCAVSYKTANDERMHFRKFFKFPVAKPIDVRTKFYNAENVEQFTSMNVLKDNLNNDVYLEAQIQNTSDQSMVLESVVLEPSEFYTSTEISPSNINEKILQDLSLNPNDIRQFLYCLKPKIVDHPHNYHRKGTSIGKLDMVWKTAMGERGHLQTSSLQRMAPGYGDLRLTIEKIPAVVNKLEMFEMVCRLHNCSERSLDLVLTVDEAPQPNIIFCSISNLELGQLPPNSTSDFTLNLLPLNNGLQSISGIRVTDKFLRRTYEHDDIAQIFVK